MKNNFEIKIICFLCLVMAAFGSCKKSESVDEKGLSGNHNSLAIAGDEKWDLLGYGYDMTGDPLALENASDAPIIDVKRFETDYFNRINTPTSTGGKQFYYYGATANEYLKDVIKERNFSATVSAGTKTPTKDGESYFTGSLTSKNKNQNIYSFVGKYSYARFEETVRIKIIQFNGDVDINLLKNYLTPEFLNNVNTISANALVERYGTHVLTNISLGGRLAFDFTASIINETSTETKTKSVEGALGVFVKKFGIDISSTISSTEMTRNFNESRERSFGLKFYGGTNSGRSVSFDSNGYSSESINLSGWEQSINTKNCALVAIDNAVPIFEFIADPVKKQQVKDAVDKYVRDRQINLLPTTFYEYYNPVTNRHAYNLIDNLEQSWTNYHHNAEPFKVYNTQYLGSVPLYQFYNPGIDNRVLTTNRNTGFSGYRYDGLLCYVYQTQVAGTVPVYEFYSASGGHLYTTNRNPGFAGWNYNGQPFYAFPN